MSLWYEICDLWRWRLLLVLNRWSILVCFVVLTIRAFEVVAIPVVNATFTSTIVAFVLITILLNDFWFEVIALWFTFCHFQYSRLRQLIPFFFFSRSSLRAACRNSSAVLGSFGSGWVMLMVWMHILIPPWRLHEYALVRTYLWLLSTAGAGEQYSSHISEVAFQIPSRSMSLQYPAGLVHLSVLLYPQ